MANEPIEASKHIQRAWDAPITTAAYNELLASCSLPVDQARIKALTTPHAGDWLHAPIITAVVSDYSTRPSGWQHAFASIRMSTAYMRLWLSSATVPQHPSR